MVSILKLEAGKNIIASFSLSFVSVLLTYTSVRVGDLLIEFDG